MVSFFSEFSNFTDWEAAQQAQLFKPNVAHIYHFCIWVASLSRESLKCKCKIFKLQNFFEGDTMYWRWCWNNCIHHKLKQLHSPQVQSCQFDMGEFDCNEPTRWGRWCVDSVCMSLVIFQNGSERSQEFPRWKPALSPGTEPRSQASSTSWCQLVGQTQT